MRTITNIFDFAFFANFTASADEDGCQWVYIIYKNLYNINPSINGFFIFMSRIYWNNEKVFLEALKYSSRSEFRDNASGAYKYARINNILDSACAHMLFKGDKFNRFIYKIIFPNINSIYIGLTYNIEERKNKHIKNSSNKYVKELFESGEEYIWSCDFEILSIDMVGVIEKKLIEQYKEKGWNVLNIATAGGLGGQNKWNFELVDAEAKKYNNRCDFRINSSGAYYFASKHKILDKICSHMTPKWSLEGVKKEANKYNTRGEFSKKSPAAYSYAYRNGFLDEICGHMK